MPPQSNLPPEKSLPMQSQEHVQNLPAASRNGSAVHAAVESLQSTASDAVAGTEHMVRRHPFASVAVALGAGLALGAGAYWLLAPKRPASVLHRLRRLF